MTFVELRAELLRIDSVNPSTPEREPVHVHPKQESGAEVVSGSLVFEVAGERHHLTVGHTISVPANTPHRFWNEGSEDARSIQFFRPALDIASFFETLFALAQQSKLDEKGCRPRCSLRRWFASSARRYNRSAHPGRYCECSARSWRRSLACAATARDSKLEKRSSRTAGEPSFESAAQKGTPRCRRFARRAGVRAGPPDPATGRGASVFAARHFAVAIDEYRASQLARAPPPLMGRKQSPPRRRRA